MLKSWLHDLPIRTKLLLVIMFIVLIIILFIGGFFAVYEVKYVKESIKDEVYQAALLLGDRSSAALIFDDAKLANENLASLKALPDIVMACLYLNNSKRVFAEYNIDNSQNKSCPDPDNLPGETVSLEKKHLHISLPIFDKGILIGKIYARSGLEKINTRIAEQNLVVGACMLFAFFLALFFSRFLRNVVAGPIVKLAGLSTQIAEQGEYSLRSSIHGKDELGQLSNAYNAMLDTIEKQSNELIHVNDLLEMKVKDRTQALDDLNRSLEEKVVTRTAELKRKNEELASVNRELDQFTYIASHDLKEPLRKIKIFSQRVVEKYRPELDDMAVDYLSRMEKSVNRMQCLIDDLLAYSKTSSKGRVFSEVNLDEVIQGVLGDLEVAIEEKSAQIVIERPFPVIESDPVQMRQLFQNLISNAIKYSSDSKVPIIELSYSWVDDLDKKTNDLEDANVCQIEVKDNGVGFESRFGEKIFGIFQRLHGKSAYEGSGVGLAITKKIVENHSGSISAVGEPGVGATFIVILPIKQRETEEIVKHE